MLNNLMAVFYMLVLLGIVFAVNTVLGVVIANKKEKFDLKKLLSGICKYIIITICMLAFSLTLELIPTVLGQIGINVQDELITTVEVVLIGFTAYKKYAEDCIDKFKTILDIKEVK